MNTKASSLLTVHTTSRAPYHVQGVRRFPFLIYGAKSGERDKTSTKAV